MGPTGLEVFEILTGLGGVGENDIGVGDARIWLDRPSDVTISAQAKRHEVLRFIDNIQTLKCDHASCHWC